MCILELLLGFDVRFNITRHIQIGGALVGGYGYGFIVKKNVSENFTPMKYNSYFYYEPRILLSFKLK